MLQIKLFIKVLDLIVCFVEKIFEKYTISYPFLDIK